MGTTSSLSFIQSSVDKMSIRSGVDGLEQNGVPGSENPVFHTVSDTGATKQTVSPDQPVMSHSEPQHVMGSEIIAAEASPQLNRSRSGSSCSGVSQGSNASQPGSGTGSARPSPQRKGILPTNLPPSLADLQDPSTFKLDQSPPPGKRKVTKQSFVNKTTSIHDSQQQDPNDPLSNLDPLWTVKSNEKP